MKHWIGRHNIAVKKRERSKWAPAGPLRFFHVVTIIYRWSCTELYRFA